MVRGIGRWFGPKPLDVDEQPSALDGWSLPDEFPRQAEPVASWLDDVGVVPFAASRERVEQLDSCDLLEAIPEEVQAPSALAQVFAPPVVEAAPVVVTPPVVEAPPAFEAPSLVGLDVPQLTARGGRAWLPLVAGGIAIVCAVIGIFAAG